MRFSGKIGYLVLEQTRNCLGRTCILAEGHDAISSWNATTRVSPIFGVKSDSYSSPTEFDFAGSWSILFLGPIHPENVPILSSGKGHTWLSIGLFNVIYASQDSVAINQAVTWARETRVPFECWSLVDGTIKDTSTWDPLPLDPGWRDPIKQIWKSHVPEELKEAVQEYCPLMASTIARSAGLPFGFADELIGLNSTVSELLKAFSNASVVDKPYSALGEFLVINAALSRFSSQTFAGTSPIVLTECHFWLHSLLGIGLATIALRNIRTFIETTLGAARLHERFAKLREQQENVNLAKDPPPDKDHLGQITLDATDEIVPMLAYFSARDGYRSTEMTVSAPLAAVSACNSMRWSLLTLTHEFSHVVIRAIQAELYPNFNDDRALEHCLNLIEAQRPAENTLDEIRRVLLFSIIKMDDAATGRLPNESLELTVNSVKTLLLRWRQDVDEILVHVFDFMYFYGQDVEKYLEGIWASWGAIPNISTRVLDYVVRTICAVLTKHIRRGDNAEQLARDQVHTALLNLQSKNGGGDYVPHAINYVTTDWENVVLPKVRARRQLVKIVNSYLFSEAIATTIRSESEISGGESEKGGYRFVKNDLEIAPYSNPLRFLEFYTDTLTPNQTQSAWMLYVLAFCFKHND